MSIASLLSDNTYNIDVPIINNDDLSVNDNLTIPRKTSAEIIGLTPASGKLVYDTDMKAIFYGDGGAWKLLPSYKQNVTQDDVLINISGTGNLDPRAMWGQGNTAPLTILNPVGAPSTLTLPTVGALLNYMVGQGFIPYTGMSFDFTLNGYANNNTYTILTNVGWTLYTGVVIGVAQTKTFHVKIDDVPTLAATLYERN